MIKLIDADLHIFEERPVFDEYLDPAFRDRISVQSFISPDEKRKVPFAMSCDVRIDGYPIPAWMPNVNRTVRSSGVIEKYYARFSEGSGIDPKQYIKDITTDDVAGGALYPTTFLWVTWMPHLDAEFAGALARAYNDYIYDFCQGGDYSRVVPVCVVSLHDVQGAIKEIERNLERGFCGVFVRPNPLRGRTLGHRDYFPLYEAMQDWKMPLGIHEGTLTYQPTLGRDRVTTQAGIHIIAHPFEQMAAMVSMWEGGVFDEFPSLNTMFLEAGVGWIPFWLERIDEEKNQYRPGGSTASMTDIWNRQCFATAEAKDDFLKTTSELIGPDRLLVSSDYPHVEATFPNTGKYFNEQPVSEDVLRKVGRENFFKAYPRLNPETFCTGQ